MNTLKIKIALTLLITVSFSVCTFAGEKPKPQITVNNKVGFLPMHIKLSCNEESPDEIFLWDFGNGNTSLGRIATEVYSNPGIYKVKVVVRSGSEWAVDSVNIEVLRNDELINNMRKMHVAQAQ